MMNVLRKMFSWSSKVSGPAVKGAAPHQTISPARLPVAHSGHYDSLLDEIGDAQVVLIGEASHGTHEFYLERMKLTQRLIQEKGFSAVCWEADWPDTHEVNRYVRGHVPEDSEAIDSLSGFIRWPPWMWRNSVVLEFVGWLRDHNDSVPERHRVGVYGLDLYSLYSSQSEVISFLDRTDPQAAARARQAYACFDQPQFEEDSQTYGQLTGLGLEPSCEQQAVNVLVELQKSRATPGRRGGIKRGRPEEQRPSPQAGASGSAAAGGPSIGPLGQQRQPHVLDGMLPSAAAGGAARYHSAAGAEAGPGSSWPGPVGKGGPAPPSVAEVSVPLPHLPPEDWEGLKAKGPLAEDERFYAEENAQLVVDAENYYREMFRGRVNSWNLRDKHMFSCLQNLISHLDNTGRVPKVVVWAHNSHLGDARATEMSRRGELNLGQLVRQAYGPPLHAHVKGALYSTGANHGPASAAAGQSTSEASSAAAGDVSTDASGAGRARSGRPYGGCYNVGFSTYSGTVTAASRWDGAVERKTVRPGTPGSYEDLFHQVAAVQPDQVASGAGRPQSTRQGQPPQVRGQGGAAAGQPTQYRQSTATCVMSQAPQGHSTIVPQFMLHLRQDTPAAKGDHARAAAIAALQQPRLQRAIGVIYKPETERWSHLFESVLPAQFDTIIHIDHTRALEPLERTAPWHTGEADETYPTGL